MENLTYEQIPTFLAALGWAMAVVICGLLLSWFWRPLLEWAAPRWAALTLGGVPLAAGLLAGWALAAQGAGPGAVWGGALLIGAGAAGVTWRALTPPAVRRYADAPAHYDERRDEGETDEKAVSRGGKAETEIRGETEIAPKSPSALSATDIKLLQDEGRAYALGAALAHGLLKDGTRTAAIRAVFGDVTGARYSQLARRVRHHEAQVAATLPPTEEAEPEPARIVPINRGEKGYVEI